MPALRQGGAALLATPSEPLHVELTGSILDSAFRVQNALGVGLYEQPYKVCLAQALRKNGHKVLTEVILDIDFEGMLISNAYRIDLLVSLDSGGRTAAPGGRPGCCRSESPGAPEFHASGTGAHLLAPFRQGTWPPVELLGRSPEERRNPKAHPNGRRQGAHVPTVAQARHGHGGGGHPRACVRKGRRPHGREARSASARAAGRACAGWVGGPALAPGAMQATPLISPVCPAPL